MSVQQYVASLTDQTQFEIADEGARYWLSIKHVNLLSHVAPSSRASISIQINEPDIAYLEAIFLHDTGYFKQVADGTLAAAGTEIIYADVTRVEQLNSPDEFTQIHATRHWRGLVADRQLYPDRCGNLRIMLTVQGIVTLRDQIRAYVSRQ